MSKTKTEPASLHEALSARKARARRADVSKIERGLVSGKDLQLANAPYSSKPVKVVRLFGA